MSVLDEIVTAADSGQPIRVHTRDGEVLVARVLQFDKHELRYLVLTSSRPERYGICDSTGFTLPMNELQKVVLLKPPPRRGPAPTSQD